MEQAGGAAGDQASGPGADEVVRLCGACGWREPQVERREASAFRKRALRLTSAELVRLAALRSPAFALLGFGGQALASVRRRRPP